MVYHLDVLVVLVYCYFWFLFSVFLKRNRVLNKTHYTLRMCLFWVKIIFRNAFSEMPEFGWSGK